MRIKRGEKMCGIGGVIATLTCEKDLIPTDPPLVTTKPCEDKFTNCGELAKDNCHAHKEHCRKSCGLCECMTPHPSNTCYDEYNHCSDLCQSNLKNKCRKACGLCNEKTEEPQDESGPQEEQIPEKETP